VVDKAKEDRGVRELTDFCESIEEACENQDASDLLISVLGLIERLAVFLLQVTKRVVVNEVRIEQLSGKLDHVGRKASVHDPL
jgi:hypothetical protein